MKFWKHKKTGQLINQENYDRLNPVHRETFSETDDDYNSSSPSLLSDMIMESALESDNSIDSFDNSSNDSSFSGFDGGDGGGGGADSSW